MAKELIFMGRKAGIVRLALFDASHGTARKLPVKEISEELFVSGIKEGKLPVRGFEVIKGRISCKYGDWYTLPEVGDNGALSLFGVVSLGKEPLDTEGCIPDIDAYDKSNYLQVTAYGLASVDWFTGMFRVLAPGTYLYLKNERFMYEYGGPRTLRQLYVKDEKAQKVLDTYNNKSSSIKTSSTQKKTPVFGDIADYTFEECDSTETMQEVASWMKLRQVLGHVYLQWIFQRCERIASSHSELRYISGYMSDVLTYKTLDVVMLGKRRIECLEIPSNVRHLNTLRGRVIDVLLANECETLSVTGINNFAIECAKMYDLNLRVGSRARIVRPEYAVDMSVTCWDGFEGSNGDYRGLRIKSLSNCFNTQPIDAKLIFDVSAVSNSFNNVVGMDVTFEKPVISISSSFKGFQGSLAVPSIQTVEHSFNVCDIATPINLKETCYVNHSFNDFKGVMQLPDVFNKVDGKVFNNTLVRRIKLIPEYNEIYYALNSLNIDNPELTVDIESHRPETYVKIFGGSLKDIYFNLASGGLAPKFERTFNLPSGPVKGITVLKPETYYKLSQNTLDLSVFPDVEVLSADVVRGCSCSVVILGDGLKVVESGAFVDCPSIKWVYIPSNVQDIGSQFVYRPRVEYTICTQKGSAADLYASKYKIPVRYVSSVSDFISVTRELPEELEGAVVVATLAGTGDGEEAAVRFNCASTEISDAIYTDYAFEEKANVSVDSIVWMNDSVKAKLHEKELMTVNPRVHVLMAYLSNQSSYNPKVLDVASSKVFSYSSWRHSSGEYMMYGVQLRTTRKVHDVLWVVLKGDIVINAFIEQVSDIKSRASIKRQLTEMAELDKGYNPPTSLSAVLTHMNFTPNSTSIVGKRMPSSIVSLVETSIMRTYVPFGIYKSKAKGTVCVAVDITTLQLVAFVLQPTSRIDDGYMKDSGDPLWNAVRRSFGEAVFLDDLSGYERLYSLIGASDGVLDSIVGVETVKCEDYDYSIPEKEIEALRMLRKILLNRGASTNTLADLRGALKGCGLAKSMNMSSWNSLLNREKYYMSQRATIYLDDGHCGIYHKYNSGLVTGFVLNNSEVYILALGDGDRYEKVINNIVDLYDSVDLTAGAGFKEEHVAHMNHMFDASEFLVVRAFNSGGTYHHYGSSEPVLAISRFSGKLCLGARIREFIVPLFWASTLSNVLGISEAAGFAPYNYKEDWNYKSDSITGVFDCQADYLERKPSFRGLPEKYRDTREHLRRGEALGYACATGSQDIFDLALKHPPVSDLVQKDGE